MFERLLKRMREKIRTHQYIMTVHAEEEMDEDDLTIFDIEHCILTGEIVDVTIHDEMIEPIDTNRDADLVGITFVTPFAHRAYELASILKSQGKTVVFGGPHASLMPYEAKQFSDAVVIEEAEDTWPSLTQDFTRHNMKPFSRSHTPSLKLTLRISMAEHTYAHRRFKTHP